MVEGRPAALIIHVDSLTAIVLDRACAWQRQSGEPALPPFGKCKVSPASKKDLIPSLIRSSPIREKSDGYLGQTQTHIKYEIDYLTDSEVCWVDGVRVEYHVVFVLPTLTSNDNFVRGIWSEWFPKLLKHEHNHRDIGLGIANEINDKLNALLPEKTCEALLKNGDQIVAQLEDKEDVLHTKYDQETNHGQTEGLTPRI